MGEAEQWSWLKKAGFEDLMEMSRSQDLWAIWASLQKMLEYGSRKTGAVIRLCPFAELVDDDEAATSGLVQSD